MAILEKWKDSSINLEGCIMTYGHFSTIHPGHIRYLKHAKEIGGRLITVITGDVKTKGGDPIYPYTPEERADSLNQLGIADDIIILKETELKEAIEICRPQALVLGTEFEGAKELRDSLRSLKEVNGRAIYHSGDTHYARTDLLGKSEINLKIKQQQQYLETIRRQNIETRKLMKIIESWEKTKIIVVGDTVLDQYAACEAVGMSAEAPVVVVRELAQKNYIGGLPSLLLM